MTEPPAFPRRLPRAGDPYADAPRLPFLDDAAGAAGVRALVDIDALFSIASDRPVEIEIGGGRGAFAVERVQVDPALHLLGLEVKRKWATIVDRKLASLGHGARARVFAEDVRLALPRLRPDGRVRAVFLHFPDPWWKKRHEKRLVMGEGVQAEIERLLSPFGELFVQTDVEHRALQYRAFLDARDALEPHGDGAGDPTLIENPYGARSPREKRAIEDGLPIYRMRYRKRGG
ncbi:MAG: tRNA (guanosine(46)-N7)-methyltransferase TrmB [Polyangiales bacterium]